MQIPNTPRLTLSLMTLDDGEFMFELDQDERVMHFLNGGVKTTQQQIDTVMLPRLAQYLNPTKGWGLWKVDALACPQNDEHQLSGQYLGWILVRPMYFFTQPQWHNIELGWRFKYDSWGKGYATEAAHAVMQAISQLDEVTHISAVAVEQNVASIAIMKKLGMTFQHKSIHRDPLGDTEAVFYQKSVL
ncbi:MULTISPECIES: GNAT family N-acetyltransferase [Shewanella]|jgi:RimJ/RimL family protein N-acetyltransferase|uniref:GNAT family N-acetyltransferase n=1 Tax=Shewanella TaxID=22 RepID=UPI00200ED2F7|nr:GNAT family N-acetyltransferase [Shewanella basaltis]MCL1112718.1 GNAT family N-acetyltransferase [Shewanella basaltis]